jgi:hypothetical protein
MRILFRLLLVPALLFALAYAGFVILDPERRPLDDAARRRRPAGSSASPMA